MRIYSLGATMKTVVLLVTTLLFTSCTLSKQDSGNEQMIHHKINLGDKVLEISLPAKEQDKEFIFGKEKEIPSTVNIADRSIYNKHNVHIFIKNVWGWKSRFIGRTYGNLSFIALVQITDSESLKNSQALKTHLKEQTRKEHEEMIGNYIDGVAVVELPKKYEEIEINGKEFVYYNITYRNQPNSNYVTKLSDTHYLQLSFDYTPNSKESESNWRAAAKEIETSIVQSIKLLDDNL